MIAKYSKSILLAPDQNPAMNALWASMRYFLVVIGGLMGSAGLSQTGTYQIVMLASGSIMVVGPAAWGVWTAFQRVLDKRDAVTNAVQAGLNLAATGNMLTCETPTGVVIPVPVSHQSAAEIVKDFGPQSK
jgi:hypothetical protein